LKVSSHHRAKMVWRSILRTYHLFPQNSDLLVKLILLGIISSLIGPGHLVPVGTSSLGRAGYCRTGVLFGSSPDGFRSEGSGWGRHFFERENERWYMVLLLRGIVWCWAEREYSYFVGVVEVVCLSRVDSLAALESHKQQIN
jgi:hypothetical protein